MPFSVRRVSQANIILEIVYLLRKRHFFQKDEKTYRIIIWPARPLKDTTNGHQVLNLCLDFSIVTQCIAFRSEGSIHRTDNLYPWHGLDFSGHILMDS